MFVYEYLCLRTAGLKKNVLMQFGIVVVYVLLELLIFNGE